MQHYNRGTHKWETRNELNNEIYTYYWWDYYDDGHSYWEEPPLGVHWEYIEGIDIEEKAFQRRGLIRYPVYIKGRILRIDMMSIYSKEMLRQKKIEMILGDIQDLSNTIENLLRMKGIQISLDKS